MWSVTLRVFNNGQPCDKVVNTSQPDKRRAKRVSRKILAKHRQHETCHTYRRDRRYHPECIISRGSNQSVVPCETIFVPSVGELGYW